MIRSMWKTMQAHIETKEVVCGWAVWFGCCWWPQPPLGQKGRYVTKEQDVTRGREIGT